MPTELLVVIIGLLMVNSAVLAAWYVERDELKRELVLVKARANDSLQTAGEICSAIQKVHNEQAANLIALSKRLDEVHNKVEFSGIFKSKKL